MDVLCCLLVDELVINLFGGECCWVVLCKLLLFKFDLLLFDELINYLDVESVQWFEQYLVSYFGVILVVIYDCYFLDNVVEWILEFDCGCVYFYEGNYLIYLEKKVEWFVV